MFKPEYTDASEALRQARNAEAAIKSLREILFTWEVSFDDIDFDEDQMESIVGQCDGWKAILDVVGVRLEGVCASCLEIMDRAPPDWGANLSVATQEAGDGQS